MGLFCVSLPSKIGAFFQFCGDAVPVSKHKIYEDVLALFCGALLVALGLALFKNQGLLTGGTAGIALLVANVVPVNFGMAFFLINLPFYYLAITQIGKSFTLKTFISVTMVSVLVEKIPLLLHVEVESPAFAAVVGGLLIGMGMLVMFRHKSSLGGIGILAFYLQNKFNIRAGKLQLVIDMGILAVSFLIASLWIVALSVLGALVMNMIVAVNHKPGRYNGGYGPAAGVMSQPPAGQN
ncbi:YitT family protein [Pseudobowmanella zhangzhouensis]